MAQIQNLVIDQGASFEAKFTVFASKGLIKDLTDATIIAQLRPGYYSSTYEEFTPVVDDPTTGEIIIRMTPDKTSTLRPGRWVYDVEASFTDGISVRVVEGIVTVTPNVSRAQ